MSICYEDALNRIIDDGIEAARASYVDPEKALHLEGSIRGFSECRGLNPAQIGESLARANARMAEACREQAEDYWYWRCRAAEIEWVANVVSAILANEGLPVVVQPTARGFLKAAEILGVREPGEAA